MQSIPNERARPEGVVDALLADVVSGRFTPGARLPPERDLVERFGTSRVTIRAALARLADRGVIAVRRGSGAVVRPWRDWSLHMLPAFLHHAAANPAAPSPTGVLADVLALRRAITLDAVGRAAGHVRRGQLDGARAAVGRAWEARHDAEAFAREDFEMARSILEAAGMLAGVWLVNDLTTIYVEAVRPLGAGLAVADDYVEVHMALCAALERGDARRARRIMAAHQEAQDRLLLETLGVAAAGGAVPPARKRGSARKRSSIAKGRVPT